MGNWNLKTSEEIAREHPATENECIFLDPDEFKGGVRTGTWETLANTINHLLGRINVVLSSKVSEYSLYETRCVSFSFYSSLSQTCYVIQELKAALHRKKWTEESYSKKYEPDYIHGE